MHLFHFSRPDPRRARQMARFFQLIVQDASRVSGKEKEPILSCQNAAQTYR
jgi:hypothetical protein